MDNNEENNNMNDRENDGYQEQFQIDSLTDNNYNYGNNSNENNSYNMNSDNHYNVNNEKQKADNNAHNMAIASLVLGIVSIVLSCCCGGTITLICGIIGIVLWYNAKDYEGNRESMANAGMICSIIGIILSVIVFVTIILCGVLGEIGNSL